MIRSQVVSFLISISSSEGSADICRLEIVLVLKEGCEGIEMVFVVKNGLDVNAIVLVIHDTMRRDTMDAFMFVIEICDFDEV